MKYRSKKSRKPRSKKSRKPRSKKSRKPRSKKSRKPRSKKSRKPRSKDGYVPQIEDLNESIIKNTLKQMIRNDNSLDTSQKKKLSDFYYNLEAARALYLINNYPTKKNTIYRNYKNDKLNGTDELIKMLYKHELKKPIDEDP
jgi:hypothetical protein